MTAETVRAALTPRTKAIVAVHLYGNVAPVDELARAGPAGARGRRPGGGRHAARPARGLAGHGGHVLLLPVEEPARASATAARSSPTTTRWPARRAGCAFTAPRTRRPSWTWATTRGWTSCRRPRCGFCCRSSTAGRPPAGGGGRLRPPGPGRPRDADPRPVDGRRARLPPLRGPRSSEPTSWRRRSGERGIGARGYYRVPSHLQPAVAHLLPEGLELPGHGRAGAHRPGPADGHRACRRSRRARWSRPWPPSRRPRNCSMRVWVDLTNSPHVLVMRPLIEAMREDGHEVEVTARDFAQTLELCERLGVEHTAVGRHRGERLASKGLGLASRSAALVRWARGRRFDVAMGHGSNDVSVAAALLRIPSSTAFDYEWAKVQHNVNCRLVRAGGGARRDPAGAPGPLRRTRQGARLPGPEGGVLPRRLRARPRRAVRAVAGSGAADRGGAHAAGGVAVPPLREPAVRPRAGAPARHAGRGAAAHGRPARRDPGPRRADRCPSGRSTPRA